MPRKSPPPGETKRGKFKRLAEPRTTNILEALRILGNLANRNIYDYHEGDILQIFSAIEARVEAIKSKFEAQSSKKEEFKLED